MSDPMIGEVRLFANTFVPQGWLLCDGSRVSITTYSDLFNILGTRYGGDGQSNFAVPNLVGRAAIGAGTARSGTKFYEGETYGEEAITLTTAAMPSHSHILRKKVTDAPNPVSKTSAPSAVSDLGGLSDALGKVAYKSAINVNPMPDTALDHATIGPAGNSMPHENRQPYLCIYYAIAYEGTTPHT